MEKITTAEITGPWTVSAEEINCILEKTDRFFVITQNDASRVPDDGKYALTAAVSVQPFINHRKIESLENKNGLIMSERDLKRADSLVDYKILNSLNIFKSVNRDVTEAKTEEQRKNWRIRAQDCEKRQERSSKRKRPL